MSVSFVCQMTFEMFKKMIFDLYSCSVVLPTENTVWKPIKEASTGTIGALMTAVVLNNYQASLSNCISKGSGWQDYILGDFRTKKNSPYCSSNCSRSLTCCTPQRESEIAVKFIYSTSKTNGARIRFNDDVSRQWVQSSSNKTLVWIVHGFRDNVTRRAVFNETKDAFIDRGDYDVILVDWSRGNKEYFQSLANVRVIGAIVGRMMDFLGVEGRSVCSGFSLGAHICGEAGSWLKQRKNKVLSKCHGIDPAGFQFDGCGPEVRLDPSDCGIVTAIHTSQYNTITSLIGKEGLGTKVKTGHCDFWLNDGMDQPNCTTETNFFRQLMPKKSCHHARAIYYYVSQIKKACNFEGKEAKCGSAQVCKLSPERGTSSSSLSHPPQMIMSPDDSCSSAMNVDYHAKTTGIHPFC